jgi:hypothetical protein
MLPLYLLGDFFRFSALRIRSTDSQRGKAPVPLLGIGAFYVGRRTLLVVAVFIRREILYKGNVKAVLRGD